MVKINSFDKTVLEIGLVTSLNDVIYDSSITSVIGSSPRLVKRLIAIAVDASLCLWTVWFSYYLRLGEFVTIKDATLFCVLLSVGLCIPIFMTCGLYKSIFRYIGWPALLLIFRALAIYGVLYLLYLQFTVFLVFHAIGIIQPILLLCSFASRMFAGLLLVTENKLLNKSIKKC